VRTRVIGVSHCHQTRVGVCCQRVHGIEQRLGNGTGLVNNDEHVAGVDTLKGPRVIVGGLAAVGDEFLTDVPLCVQRDPAWQSRLAVGHPDIPPDDSFHLRCCWRCRDDKGFARRMHVDVDPPSRKSRDCVGLRDVEMSWLALIAL
jgi:hypothetical protein